MANFFEGWMDPVADVTVGNLRKDLQSSRLQCMPGFIFP
jgi:hypothetical protein